MDANLLHISYEGDILEDPWAEPEEDMWRWTVSPEDAPDKAEYVELCKPKTVINHIGIFWHQFIFKMCCFSIQR
jgi:argininosuccinate synthase